MYVAITGLSARSSCQVWSISLLSGPFADLAAFAARAGSARSNPRGASNETMSVRRIAAFSATQAPSGKGLAAYMPHRGTEAQQLHVFEVRVAGHQLHVRVVQERGEETHHAVEAFARARQVLHLAHDLGLPVLR